MNNICIVGRITKDIKVVETENSKSARFNVAVSKEKKNENGEREADFFPCVAWNNTAVNIAKYFKKGYPIGICGTMNSRVFTTEDGKKQTTWELTVRSFYFVGKLDVEVSEPEEEPFNNLPF